MASKEENLYLLKPKPVDLFTLTKLSMLMSEVSEEGLLNNISTSQIQYHKEDDENLDYSYSGSVYEKINAGHNYVYLRDVARGNVISVPKKFWIERSIPLREFFKDAKYIGKEVYLTEPVDNDYSFVRDEGQEVRERVLPLHVILLYQGDTHVILYMYATKFLGGQLVVLDERYAQANWITTGEQYAMYDDPEDVIDEFCHGVKAEEKVYKLN